MPARPAFDEASAAVFLARARAGETINGLLRETGAPGRRAYAAWKAWDRDFAEAIHALRLRRDQQIGAHGKARRRGFDQALADRVIVGLNKGLKLNAVLAGDPDLPCRPTLRRWRREEPEFDAILRRIMAVTARRRQVAPGCTPAMIRRIVARIVEGATFASLGREAGMPSRAALRRWVKARPDFAHAVAQACEDRDEGLRERIIAVAEAAGPAGAVAAHGEIMRLRRQLVRLRHRPGAAHRRQVTEILTPSHRPGEGLNPDRGL